ncbi:MULTISPECIES: hypothetical protein [Vibrio]|uniref:hypothetical protein n=1 Tax=Vibrio TaxID=662 RepID=UPI001BD5DF93|nr:hypothetical protein [Vibrio alginolyticus]EHR0228745.1 hypothetical protein [Vibrio parahaemolyticus]EIO3704333.1 hypothetical protein [Vibrio parahaemolyticus]EIV8506760.1 hypothetical protein [Vibrio parahaemolyticus]ELA9872609.1 hypothetical protein [Vibrio parahaemolyticus]MBT0014460.1 hypothetical protein [Vibrio alginolyticus]
MEAKEESKQSDLSVLEQLEHLEDVLQDTQEKIDSLLKQAQDDVLKQFKIDAEKCRITNEQIAEAFGIRIAKENQVTELNPETPKQPQDPKFYYEGHILRTINANTLKKEPWRDLYLSGEINKYRVAYAKFLGGRKGIDEKWDIVYKDSKEPKPDWAIGDENNVNELVLNNYKV